MRAVAPAEIGRFANLLFAIDLEKGSDVIVVLLERLQGSVPLNGEAEFRELLHEKSLMVVLRERQHERVWGHIHASAVP